MSSDDKKQAVLDKFLELSEKYATTGDMPDDKDAILLFALFRDRDWGEINSKNFAELEAVQRGFIWGVSSAREIVKDSKNLGND